VVDGSDDTGEDVDEEGGGEIVVIGGKQKHQKMIHFRYSMETLKEFQ